MTNQKSKLGHRQRLRRSAFGVLVASSLIAPVGGTATALPQPTHHTFPASSGLVGLAEGASGDDVQAVQRALISSGINVPGGADGQFGPATRRALVQFQEANSLTASGKVDQATAVALGLAPATSAPSNSGSSAAGLQQGASGDAVVELQQRLLALGVWVPGGVDGQFGSGTKRAVSNFQRWNGLTVTGIADAATARRLGLTGSSQPSTPTPATPPPAPDTPPAASDPDSYVGLAVGSSGQLVKDLQSALMAAGITLPGGADGIFGNGTKSALSNYQRANGLGVSGAVYPATARKLGLGAATPAAPPPATPPPATPPAAANPYVGLSVGSQGDRVKALQSALIAAGITVRGGADGAFGNATKTALAAYQRANGLGSAGSVDAATAQKLGLGSTTASVSSPSTTSPGTYVGLARGASGPEVKELQEALQATGLVIRGGADGTFGATTESSLKVFQRVNGFNQTGVVSQRDASILNLGAPQTNGSTAEGFAKKGESSERVRLLQQQLIDWGITVRGGADGSFGNATEAAIKQFQQTHGLSVTGTVTEQTAKKMGIAPSSPTTPPAPGAVKLERFPIQGQCYFGNTWHAPRGNGRVHEGVDLIAAEGNLLYAVVDGTITKQYWDNPGLRAGNGLRLAQDDGTYFTYLHLLDFAPGIKVGTKVKAGDVIGFNGNTGSSATAHLHFEIHPGGGAAVNPYPYIKAIDECDNTTPQYQSSFAE